MLGVVPRAPIGVLRRRVQAALLVCGALSALVLMLAATDVAVAEERGHTFTHSFGAPGSGEGQLSEPWDVAVNEATDDLYVVDHGNDRVEIFHEAANGTDTYVGEFNGSGLLSDEGKAAGSSGLGEELETGQFLEPTQIAVDNACHYKKLTGSSCEKFDPSNEDVYVVDLGHAVIDKYSPSGRYIGQITASESGGRFENKVGEAAVTGVAVGPDGTLYVGALNHGKIIEPSVFIYNDAVHNGTCDTCVQNNFELSFSEAVFMGEGLAVDGEGDVYAHLSRPPSPDKVAEYTPSGTLLRVLDVPPWGLASEWSGNDVYIGSGEEAERFAPAGDEPIEQFGRAGLDGSGLALDGATESLFAPDRSTGVVDVFGLEPSGLGSIKNTRVLNVGSSTAVFAASVNPRGSAATYHVEYGKCSANACAGSPLGERLPATGGVVAGSRFEPAQVDLVVSALSPDAEYHFRVVVENEAGTDEGEEITFTTRPQGQQGLLDGRVWEQVSPEAKNGALLAPIAEQGISQAATDGGAVTYLASNPTEAQPPGDADAIQVLSRREIDGGWVSLDIPTAHQRPTGKSVGAGQEYKFFSEDLSQGLVQPFGEFLALSASASEQTAYLRTNFGPGGSGLCREGCYRPLVTGCPEGPSRCEAPIKEIANVPAGTVFGIKGEACEIAKTCGPEARAASRDLSAALVESSVSLHEGDPAGLYEWAAGKLYYAGSGVLRGSPGFLWVSDGGSRVVTGTTAAGAPLRLTDPLSGEETQLDAGAGCGGCESGGAEYPWVVSEGARVFFRDKRALTEGADGGEGAADLYVCEVPTERVACDLKDLTPKPGSGHSDVLGVVGVGEDGQSVYFAANGDLAAGAVSGSCEEGSSQAAECNLYVVRREGAGWSAPRLVAVLNEADQPDWADTLNHHTARVSGEWLAFMSDRSLTGYDNRDVVSGEPDEEVYAYHASGSGSLVCVSCDPTGERPHGVEYANMGRLASGDRVWPSSQWVAANVPGWTPFALDQSDYDARFVSSAGRVFFDSSDGLTADAANGEENVYEWEPAQVGSCTSSGVMFSSVSGGCLSLVSSGGAAEESGFLDASASGGDVFFLTSAQLVKGDADSAVDVYDAHECSAATPCGSAANVSPIIECGSSETCQPYRSAVASGTFASEVFAESGNLGAPVSAAAPKPTATSAAQRLARALKSCRREHAKKRRRTCEARARREYRLPATKRGTRTGEAIRRG